MNDTTPEQAMKELTMVLLYLSRFNEGGRFASDLDMAWNGYDFGILNKLDEEDLIRQGSHRAKSVVITEDGIRSARQLLKKYNIPDWETGARD